MIVFGKVTHYLFHSADNMYHVFNIRRHGGAPLVATYRGPTPPEALKTVEYEFRGEEVEHPKYGKQIAVISYSRSTAKGNPRSSNRHIKKLEQDAAQHMKNL